MRLRYKPWASDEFAHNPLFLKNAITHKGNWSNFFNNNNPIHLEIGCGKGQFITRTALANPNINYIAIEKEDRILCMSLRQAKEILAHENLGNLYFCMENAENILDIFSNNELSRIYINFCDPWRSRKKWHKRRLTHSNFLSLYENILKKDNNAALHFKTDNLDLFNFSLNELAKRSWQLQFVTRNLHENELCHGFTTEYEEKFMAKGLPIYYLEALFKPQEDKKLSN